MKFDNWEIKLDSNGQPILPKQVICRTDKFSDIEPEFKTLANSVTGFTVGQIYDVLPYPHKLNIAEVRSVMGKNGMLFMDDPKSKNGMRFYINKRYFEPIY